MAKDIDRKALKEDAFRNTAFWMIDWVYQRRAIFITAALVLVVGFGSAIGYYQYRQSALETQSLQFHEAERAGVGADLSETESQTRVRAAFQDFLAKHPDSPLAPAAWMHVARLAWKASDTNGARAAFHQVREHSESSVALRNLAIIGLATLDEAQGELDQAAEKYRSVKDGVYDQLKALSLGRVASLQNKPEEARRLFEEAARGTEDSQLSEWARQQLDYHP